MRKTVNIFQVNRNTGYSLISTLTSQTNQTVRGLFSNHPKKLSRLKHRPACSSTQMYTQPWKFADRRILLRCKLSPEDHGQAGHVSDRWLHRCAIDA